MTKAEATVVIRLVKRLELVGTFKCPIWQSNRVPGKFHLAWSKQLAAVKRLLTRRRRKP